MPPSIHPVVYYAVAGVLIAGAPPAGIYLARQGQRESARRLQAKDFEIKNEALTAEKDLAELRKEAIQAGVDPDAVVAGYEALRDGQISPEDVLARIRRDEIGG
jgi:hypothetical protein